MSPDITMSGPFGVSRLSSPLQTDREDLHFSVVRDVLTSVSVYLPVEAGNRFVKSGCDSRIIVSPLETSSKPILRHSEAIKWYVV